MITNLETPKSKNFNWHDQARLEVVPMGNPILRMQARELSRDEILSPKIQQLIEIMKNTICGRGSGLAAPQIGCSIQLAVIEYPEEDIKKIPDQYLKLYEIEPIPFHIIINPKMTIDETEYVEFYEGCLSIKNCAGVVPRARKVRVECLNEKAEPIVIEAQGWYARILQHEIGHLDGSLCLDYAKIKTLVSTEDLKL